jgi:hypothetical protein
VANEYAGLEEVKATLELSGESQFDPDLSRALTAASRAVDSLCGRRFWLDADDTSVRYYGPTDVTVDLDDGAWKLKIHDLVDLASFKADQDGDGTFEETWTVNADFLLEPLNAAEDGRPWTTIKRHPLGSYTFPCYPRSIEVTGQFGWAAVPAEIKEATVILAAKIFRRSREAPFGVITVGIEGGAAMRIARTDPDVMMLVGDYVRTPIASA